MMLLTPVKPQRVIPCAIYAPGRTISQLVVMGKNVPGCLAKIASKIAEYGINILSGLVTAEPDPELTPEQLADELKTSRNAIS